MATIGRLLAGFGAGVHRLFAPMWSRVGIQPAVGNLGLGAGVGAWLYDYFTDDEANEVLTIIYTLGAVVVLFLGFLGWKSFVKLTK